MRHLKTTRRTFVTHTAALGITLPAMLPRLVRAAPANEKLNIACVGTANRAAADLRGVAGENLVALAEVDERYLKKAAEKHNVGRRYTDYRRMLEKEQKDLDAVVVATPDHHHAIPSLIAMNLGKHVYCEKPLAHTVEEVRLMTEAAARNNVATQMGTQIHATDHYRRMVELVRSGALGTVREVHIWQPGSRVGGEIPDQEHSVPGYLHWDRWLGSAERRAYHPGLYHPGNWRGWWDFGGGTLSDIACHVVDLAHWALNLQHPNSVEAFGDEPRPERPPHNLMAHYHHPAAGDRPAVRLTWYHGSAHKRIVDVRQKFGVPEKWNSGRNILFVGDRGKLLTSYNRHLLLPEERFADFSPPEKTIEPSPGHHQEWINACKSGPPALCNFDYAGDLTESVLLGLVAHRAGNTKIRFDAEALKVTNNSRADGYLRKSYRKGWEIRNFA